MAYYHDYYYSVEYGILVNNEDSSYAKYIAYLKKNDFRIRIIFNLNLKQSLLLINIMVVFCR